MAMNGQALLIVQFYVGEDVERSYVKLYDELAKHEDMFPKGVYKPMVKHVLLMMSQCLGSRFGATKWMIFSAKSLKK
jgi:multidrug efflux pump subunit AcrB